MKTLKGFLEIFRIPEQAIYLVPFLFGMLDSGFRDNQTILIVGIGLIFLGLAAFATNEYVDGLDTDKFNDRNKNAPLDFKKYKSAIIAVFLFFSFIGSVIFLYYHLFIPLILLYIFGMFYSLPPLRFKGRFPWDMIAPLLSCGLAPYLIGFNLAGLPFETVLSISLLSLGAIGFCFQGIHEIADLEADKKAGLATWATILGYHNFLRILDKVAIAGLLGIIYLVYRHENWWIYPMLIVSSYQLLVIGYMRAAIYQPGLTRLHSIGKRAFPIGAAMLIGILIFQIWALYQPIDLLK